MQLLCNGKVVFVLCVCAKIAAESSNVRFPATSAEVGIFQESAGQQSHVAFLEVFKPFLF